MGKGQVPSELSLLPGQAEHEAGDAGCGQGQWILLWGPGAPEPGGADVGSRGRRFPLLFVSSLLVISLSLGDKGWILQAQVVPGIIWWVIPMWGVGCVQPSPGQILVLTKPTKVVAN